MGMRLDERAQTWLDHASPNGATLKRAEKEVRKVGYFTRS
jgi:hypothetical protein